LDHVKKEQSGWVKKTAGSLGIWAQHQRVANKKNKLSKKRKKLLLDAGFLFKPPSK